MSNAEPIEPVADHAMMAPSRVAADDIERAREAAREKYPGRAPTKGEVMAILLEQMGIKPMP